jgi:hypothetical protein
VIDELLETARVFARDELRPVALAYDESEEYPLPLVHRAAELGLTCFDLPAEYGGGGIDSLGDCCRLLEELAWGDSPITWVITQGSFFAGPMLALGTAEQQQRWLPRLAAPEPPLRGRDHRAGGRLRRGRDQHGRPSRRRRLRARRGQEVHRQRAERRALRRLRDGRARHALARDHRLRRRGR